MTAVVSIKRHEIPIRGVYPGMPLTPREIQITKYLAEGLSNKEIAGHLFLSPFTIKAHLARITTKLGARNRAHIVGLTLEQY